MHLVAGLLDIWLLKAETAVCNFRGLVRALCPVMDTTMNRGTTTTTTTACLRYKTIKRSGLTNGLSR